MQWLNAKTNIPDIEHETVLLMDYDQNPYIGCYDSAFESWSYFIEGGRTFFEKSLVDSGRLIWLENSWEGINEAFDIN